MTVLLLPVSSLLLFPPSQNTPGLFNNTEIYFLGSFFNHSFLFGVRSRLLSPSPNPGDDARSLSESLTASSQLTSRIPALRFSYFLPVACFPGTQHPPPSIFGVNPCPPSAEVLTRLYLSRARGGDGEGGKDARRRGGGSGRGREKGTNLQLALQSGMRRMHKQLLCSAPLLAPLTYGPPNSYPGRHPLKAAELLHEYS